jgi:hypothetical protein
MIQIMEQKDFDSLLMLIKGQTERMNGLEDEIRILKTVIANLNKKVNDTHMIYGPGYNYAPKWQEPPSFDLNTITCRTDIGYAQNGN